LYRCGFDPYAKDDFSVAARQIRRWRLTDFQRLFVAITVAAALFLVFMAIGMSSGVLLMIALVLLVVVGLLVFLLGLRHSGVSPIQVEARVVSAPAPPVGKIVSPATMRLQVEFPDGRLVETRHRDPSVSVTKWPRMGVILPAEFDPRSRALRIRWDRVGPNTLEPVTIVPRPTRPDTPFYQDYADRTAESHREPAYDAPAITRTAEQPLAIAATSAAVLPDAAGERGPAPGQITAAPRPSAGPELEREPVREPERAAYRQPEPDHEPDPESDPERRARAAGYELPLRSGIPQPRPAEPDPSPAGAASGGDPDTAGMGAMLIVSDLERSVSFYRDLVGLDLVDQAANTAVLSYGSGRVLLRQLADMSKVDRHVSHLHIQVSNVDASFRELRSRGVLFKHEPRVMRPGDRLDLWGATFEDPDGHDIAVTQWQHRE
jgi:catechol 2,3-dioxygenase-like lactoylglutathione lyase family enzyme